MNQCGARSTKIGANRFGHRCASGGPAAGSLLPVGMGQDMGMEFLGSPVRGQNATIRADRILPGIAALKAIGAWSHQVGRHLNLLSNEALERQPSTRRGMLEMRGTIQGGTRRELMKAVATAVGGVVAGTFSQLRCGRAETNKSLASDQVEVRLELTQDELALEKNTTDMDDLQITSESKPAPKEIIGLEEPRFVQIVVVIATATVATLAKRLVDHWLKSQERGVEIDARTNPPTITTISNVPQGFIVIIDRDGKISHHKAEYDKSEDLEPLLATIF